MGSGGVGERPGAAFVAVCWGERRRGAHLQGCAAAGGRQGAAGSHPGPAGLPEVGRVVPTDAWQGGCGATAGEKQSRSDPQAGSAPSGAMLRAGLLIWLPTSSSTCPVCATLCPQHRTPHVLPGHAPHPELPQPARCWWLPQQAVTHSVSQHSHDGHWDSVLPHTFAGGGQGCCRVPLRNDVG